MLADFYFRDGVAMGQAKIRWDWRVKDGRALLGRLWDPRLRADTDARAMTAVQEALDAVERVAGPCTNTAGPNGEGWYYSIFREDARRVPYGPHPEGGLRAGDALEHVQHSFHLWLVFPTEAEMQAVQAVLPVETRV
ncbi:hypothetical protein GN316_00325 [Xylophilus sp. Kf1]|nr:hypothetical protein [Xylophilus sp. Kf1]